MKAWICMMHVTWFGLNSKLHLNVWLKATRVETSVNPHQEIFIPAQPFPVLIPMHVSIMRVGIFGGRILLRYSIPAALHFPWTPPIPVTCDVRHEPGARLATCLQWLSRWEHASRPMTTLQFVPCGNHVNNTYKEAAAAAPENDRCAFNRTLWREISSWSQFVCATGSVNAIFVRNIWAEQRWQKLLQAQIKDQIGNELSNHHKCLHALT